MDMLLLFYSIEGLKITANLFFGDFHILPTKSENIQICAFYKFAFHISWRQSNELVPGGNDIFMKYNISYFDETN